MIDKISSGLGLYNATGSIAKPIGNVGESRFAGLVNDAVGNLQGSLGAAEHASLASLSDEVNLEDLATAVSDAEVTLKALVAIRDRIIAAYQDIIKMPI